MIALLRGRLATELRAIHRTRSIPRLILCLTSGPTHGSLACTLTSALAGASRRSLPLTLASAASTRSAL